MDPATAKVLARVPVGATSYESTAAAGSMWVTNRTGDTVQRVSPATNRVTKTLRFPGLAPGGIVSAGGALWIGDDLASAVYRLDTRTLRWARVRTTGDRSTWVATTPGALWVANGSSNTVTRISLRTRKATATIKVGQSPVNLAVVAGKVWVPNDFGNSVSVIDPATNRVDRDDSRRRRTPRSSPKPRGTAG